MYSCGCPRLTVKSNDLRIGQNERAKGAAEQKKIAESYVLFKGSKKTEVRDSMRE